MNNEAIYLSYDQALDLVGRISTRALNFDYKMSKSEMEAMASLLSDVGVTVDDLVDVSRLADNYAINAEIVTSTDTYQYSQSSLEDALFTWKEDGQQYYCLNW